MRERINVRKAAITALVINAIQIAAALAMLAMLLWGDVDALHHMTMQAAIMAACLLVGWGAVVDIREARASLRRQGEQEALTQAYARLEELNKTLRAQRHDFINHLQVIFSLIEMQEGQEAIDYITRIHGDMQRVNRIMRTANPAINALLKAKLAHCEGRGIQMHMEISSPWEELPMPSWEMCRILANLIDNAIDALQTCKNPCLTIVLYEDLRFFRFRVENNGEPIDPTVKERLFTPGFTTKGAGRGMGLYIVDGLLRQYHGEMSVVSGTGRTAFDGMLPKAQAPVAEDA